MEVDLYNYYVHKRIVCYLHLYFCYRSRVQFVMTILKILEFYRVLITTASSVCRHWLIEQVPTDPSLAPSVAAIHVCLRTTQTSCRKLCL